MLTRLTVATLPRSLRVRDDSDESTAFLDNRKPEYLMLGHDSQRFIQILPRIHGDEPGGRHIVGLPFDDGRGVRNRIVSVDRARIGGHDVSNASTHRPSFVFGIARCVPRAIPCQTVKIQHVSYGQRVRKLALSFPETYEDSPWGFPVFKVGDNKMFAGMSDDTGALHLTVKLTPEEREIALHFPYVRVARYLGRYGWVTAEVTDGESLENALEWLRESYWLNAPANLRGAVEGT